VPLRGTSSLPGGFLACQAARKRKMPVVAFQRERLPPENGLTGKSSLFSAGTHKNQRGAGYSDRSFFQGKCCSAREREVPFLKTMFM